MPTVTHTDLIAQMDAETRRTLLARSDRCGLIQITGHLGAMTATGSWVMNGFWGWPVALMIHGVLLVFLFTALHETIHETAFASGWMNRIVAVFCGFVLILPPRWFRAFHFAHHRHTNDPAHDPELATPPPATWPDYAWRLTGLPVWWGHIKGLLSIASGRQQDDFVPPRAREKVVREARWFIAGYAALAGLSVITGTTALIWLWIVPAMLGQPFLRAYLMAEHTLCPHNGNMLENSRTTFTARVIRAFAWNMPYHAEHHSYPNVPFHKLPAFHELTKAHLGTTADGYASFHREMLSRIRT